MDLILGIIIFGIGFLAGAVVGALTAEERMSHRDE